jgi:hypothetical protein
MLPKLALNSWVQVILPHNLWNSWDCKQAQTMAPKIKPCFFMLMNVTQMKALRNSYNCEYSLSPNVYISGKIKKWRVMYEMR